MEDVKRPVGRPRRYEKFDRFEAGLPQRMTKRPAYCDGIGIFNGTTGSTVWVKLRMARGGVYRGRSIPAGGSVEHKLGKRASWDWQQMITNRSPRREHGSLPKAKPPKDVAGGQENSITVRKRPS